MNYYYGYISTTYFKHNDVMKVTWTGYDFCPKRALVKRRRGQEDIPHESPPFTHPKNENTKWCLYFDEFVANDGPPSLFFKLLPRSCYVDYVVSFKSFEEERFTTREIIRGGEFVIADKFKPYDEDKPVVIEFTIARKNSKEAEEMMLKLPSFGALHDLDELMDMSFKTEDGIEFKAHKLIVSLASPVLKSRLLTQIGDKNDPILVPYHSDIFKTFLEFMNGQHDHSLDIAGYMDLFMISNFYSYDRLSSHCLRMIVIHLNRENLMQVLCHDIVVLVEAEPIVKACVTLLQESKREGIKDWDQKGPIEADFIFKHFKYI